MKYDSIIVSKTATSAVRQLPAKTRDSIRSGTQSRVPPFLISTCTSPPAIYELITISTSIADHILVAEVAGIGS